MQGEPRVIVEATRLSPESARASFRIGDRSYDVGFQFSTPSRPVGPLGDVWLPIALLVGMRTGYAVTITDPVSSRLAASQEQAQAVLATWYADLHRVDLEARRARRRRFRRPDTIQMFTGGVDSYYTLVTSPEVRRVVYLHDLVHDVPAVRARMLSHVTDAAARAGRSITHLATDVRSMLDEYVEWGSQSHGAVLAAAAAIGSIRPTRCLIPASHTYRELFPWGSHPLLDPLWSSDGVRIEHHGADTPRTEKIRRIVAEDGVLDHLRVCWRTTTAINCSTCEKCIRTMTTLELLGVRGRAITFADSFDVARVATIDLRNENDAAFAEDNLLLARSTGRKDIVEALEHAIAAGKRKSS